MIYLLDRSDFELGGDFCAGQRVPFQLTRMDSCSGRSLLWLWARCGKSWVVEQELQLQSDMTEYF